MKIQETAFVLVALVLLFSMGFLFFSRLQYAKIVEKGEQLKQEKALSMLDKIAAMPEFRCSSSLGSATETLCIDKDKVKIFSQFKEEYKDMWKGLSSIKIMQIYPVDETYVIYSKGSSGNVSYSNFISLCEEEVNGVSWFKCNIGMIIVSI